jgi:hypothetical protein
LVLSVFRVLPLIVIGKQTGNNNKEEITKSKKTLQFFVITSGSVNERVPGGTLSLLSPGWWIGWKGPEDPAASSEE